MQRQTQSVGQLTALLIAALAVGCSSDEDRKDGPAATKQGSSPSKKPNGEKQGEEQPTVTDAIALKATDYFGEFKTNGARAGQKYKGRVLELTGVVRDVGQMNNGTMFLWLEGGTGELDTIHCPLKDPQAWKKVLPGQTVKVRCKPASALPGKHLENAEVLAVTGKSPLPTLTVEALAAEFAADATSAKKKYGRTRIIVTGEWTNLSFSKGLKPVFAFQGPKRTAQRADREPIVVAHVEVPCEDDLKSENGSTKVRIVAKAIDGDDEQVSLFGCILYPAD